VAFSPDGKTLTSGSYDTTIKLWDVETGKEQATLQGHTGPVYAVALSPDGNSLASGSHDKTVKLWDVATGKERFTMKGHSDVVWSVRYSPDGKILATLGNGQIKLWDLADDGPADK
jgi:WD40 repeat protein